MAIQPLTIGQKEDTPEKVTATQNIPANRKLPMAEFNQIVGKVNEVVQVVNETDNSGKLTGTQATDAEIQIEVPVAEDNKFVSRSKLYNWWTWVKTRGASISGLWNFTGGLKKSGVDVATVDDVAAKLNSGANAGLAGASIRLPRVSADGTISADAFLTWLAASRELVIGSAGNSGKLNVYSEIFELVVQDNIQSGQARLLINANQDDAFSIVDKAGIAYQTIRTTSNGVAVINRARTRMDAGIYLPLDQMQAAIESMGAGVKVYAKDLLGNEITVPFSAPGNAMMVKGSLLVKNSSSSQVIAAEFKASIKNVGGVITVTQPALDVLTTNSTYATFAMGVEAVGTNLKFYFTTNASDSTKYIGGFTELKFASTYVS